MIMGAHLCVGGWGGGLLVHVCAKCVCVCVYIHVLKLKLLVNLNYICTVCRHTPAVGSITAQVKPSSLTATRLLFMTERC